MDLLTSTSEGVTFTVLPSVVYQGDDVPNFVIDALDGDDPLLAEILAGAAVDVTEIADGFIFEVLVD